MKSGETAAGNSSGLLRRTVSGGVSMRLFAVLCLSVCFGIVSAQSNRIVPIDDSVETGRVSDANTSHLCVWIVNVSFFLFSVLPFLGVFVLGVLCPFFKNSFVMTHWFTSHTVTVPFTAFLTRNVNVLHVLCVFVRRWCR